MHSINDIVQAMFVNDYDKKLGNLFLAFHTMTCSSFYYCLRQTFFKMSVKKSTQTVNVFVGKYLKMKCHIAKDYFIL